MHRLTSFLLLGLAFCATLYYFDYTDSPLLLLFILSSLGHIDSAVEAVGNSLLCG